MLLSFRIFWRSHPRRGLVGFHLVSGLANGTTVQRSRSGSVQHGRMVPLYNDLDQILYNMYNDLERPLQILYMYTMVHVWLISNLGGQ